MNEQIGEVSAVGLGFLLLFGHPDTWGWQMFSVTGVLTLLVLTSMLTLLVLTSMLTARRTS